MSADANNNFLFAHSAITSSLFFQLSIFLSDAYMTKSPCCSAVNRGCLGMTRNVQNTLRLSTLYSSVTIHPSIIFHLFLCSCCEGRLPSPRSPSSPPQALLGENGGVPRPAERHSLDHALGLLGKPRPGYGTQNFTGKTIEVAFFPDVQTVSSVRTAVL